MANIIKYIPVTIAYLMIFTITYGFTNDYTLVKLKEGITIEHTQPIFLIVVFYISLIMTIICHILSMITDPGYVNPNPTDIESIKGNRSLYCIKCVSKRPYRSHHCSQCKRCVQKMDHHCPWIANCIGLRNQKYFFLFLLYCCIGDIIALLCLWPNLLNIDMNVRVKNTPNIFQLTYLMRDQLITIFATLFSLFTSVAIGLLMVIQFINIRDDITSIEMKIYPDGITPWNKTKSDRLRAVLGDNILIWLLPLYQEVDTCTEEDYICLIDDYI
jgi:hypothetical protein